MEELEILLKFWTEDPNQSQAAARSTGAEQVRITPDNGIHLFFFKWKHALLIFLWKKEGFFNVYEIVFRFALFMLCLWCFLFCFSFLRPTRKKICKLQDKETLSNKARLLPG